MRSRRIEPGPGQESVWDYPRPPSVEPTARIVRVEFAGLTVAESGNALRVLETSHPPVYYVPLRDIAAEALVAVTGTTLCVFKGIASYYDLVAGPSRSERAAWTYHDPAPGYEALTDAVAFYPSRVTAAYVDRELVVAQAGDFYGGWITEDVVGPFKGSAGTLAW